jgi:hypothetical protein
MIDDAIVWHVRRIALVVVANKLHRTAQQSTWPVDVVAPDLERGQKLLAVDSDRTRSRRAEAHLDRSGTSLNISLR